MSLDVSFRGNLGGDPELRLSQSGKTICSFSVANTDSKKTQQRASGKPSIRRGFG